MSSDKRQYVRMNTVFPVELEIFGSSGEKASDLMQGFTRDVGPGGMCVELKSFAKETEKLFEAGARLSLVINPTFSRKPIHATARIAWLRKDQDDPANLSWQIGVAYVEIDPAASRRIFDYARRLIWTPRLALAALLVMAFLFAGSVVESRRLNSENRRLVVEIVESAEKKSSVASDLYELQNRKMGLDRDLAKARGRIRNLETSMASLAADNAKRRAYQKSLDAAIERQKTVSEEIAGLQKGKERLEAAYRTLEDDDAPDAGRQMYEWLKSHRNVKTGLVASYEGDAELEDWAFTYDQSLAVQAFLAGGDLSEASAILEFFKSRAVREDGWFFNAYDTVDGTPKENLTRTGPNVWIGLAAVQHEHRAKNGRFLPLAREIADRAIGLMDTEGGIRGGPKTPWYSTEHNLDAYALFAMLNEETGETKYASARDRSLTWIKKYAYSMKERRMQRGKGDSTIATDTFSWAVAAIGPAKLAEIGFDAEEIMAFAEKHCEVAITFNRPDGKSVKARGFDFAKAQNLGRGGIVSTEWTAQVVVTYQVLARHFESLKDAEKADLYRRKAELYRNELQKFLITSPSRTGQGSGCLPYASADNVDTGHGWRTPRGTRTGSVAGTAYALFAWAEYNPFDLKNPGRKNL